MISDLLEATLTCQFFQLNPFSTQPNREFSKWKVKGLKLSVSIPVSAVLSLPIFVFFFCQKSKFGRRKYLIQIVLKEQKAKCFSRIRTWPFVRFATEVSHLYGIFQIMEEGLKAMHDIHLAVSCSTSWATIVEAMSRIRTGDRGISNRSNTHLRHLLFSLHKEQKAKQDGGPLWGLEPPSRFATQCPPPKWSEVTRFYGILIFCWARYWPNIISQYYLSHPEIASHFQAQSEQKIFYHSILLSDKHHLE